MRQCTKQAQVTADASALLPVVLLQSGAEFAVLDCARGRAWGYVTAMHRVGYIDEDALG